MSTLGGLNWPQYFEMNSRDYTAEKGFEPRFSVYKSSMFLICMVRVLKARKPKHQLI